MLHKANMYTRDEMSKQAQDNHEIRLSRLYCIYFLSNYYESIKKLNFLQNYMNLSTASFARWDCFYKLSSGRQRSNTLFYSLNAVAKIIFSRFVYHVEVRCNCTKNSVKNTLFWNISNVTVMVRSPTRLRTICRYVFVSVSNFQTNSILTNEHEVLCIRI